MSSGFTHAFFLWCSVLSNKVLYKRTSCLQPFLNSLTTLGWISTTPPQFFPIPASQFIFISWTGKWNLIWNNSLCKYNELKMSRWYHPGVSLKAFTSKPKLYRRSQRGGQRKGTAMRRGGGTDKTGKTQESWQLW